MTAVERRANLDATLATIDSALADYKADRREAWIDENLNHPGQLHVCIAKEPWFERWVDGKIADDQAQSCADEVATNVEKERRRFVGRVMCWYCGGWTEHGENMHAYCESDWDDAVKGNADRDALYGLDRDHHWSRCVRSDGTGHGGGWDEEGNALPPAELVDGIGLTVGPHVFCMARLK